MLRSHQEQQQKNRSASCPHAPSYPLNGSTILPPRWRELAVCAAIIGVPVGMIVLQPDLGTGMLVAASGVFAVFLAGIAWWRIALFAGLGISALPVAWTFLMPYQRDRILTFMDPESDPLGTGWNIIQSKAAIGSGGVFGKGWLMGTQSHLDFLPESHTDFIIAVMGEEFGLVGICVLLLIYLLLIGRGLVITAQAQTLFGKFSDRVNSVS